MDWNKINVGDYLMFRAYKIIDPDTYTDVGIVTGKQIGRAHV